jgi:hypothetical protein
MTFSWLDYTIFGVYLAASVGVGLLSARGSKSLGDYFLAGRGMNSILVAMSILAALFSGISYLAGPADVYKNGFGFAYVVLAFFIATPFTAIWMLPKFYQSRFYTAYQFLEERFALPVRLLASGLFIFRVALWLAAATYAPALALEKVTGIPLWITILASGTLTTLYTALGGMRAVIWTDVMQLMVLFGGQLLIVMVALGKIPGGLGGVWDTAVTDGRMDLSFSFSIAERVNIWSLLLAGAFLHLVQMATDQVSVQRYLTAGSLKEAQRSLVDQTLVRPACARALLRHRSRALRLLQNPRRPTCRRIDRQRGPNPALLRRHTASRWSSRPAHRRHLRRQHVHDLRRPQFPRSATVVDFKQRLSKAPGAPMPNRSAMHAGSPSVTASSSWRWPSPSPECREISSSP